VSIALRTQQIIAHESGVANTVDPLAGSYAIEYLTNEIERRARAYIDRIDALGGALAAIEEGYIQQEIADAAYDYQKKVEDEERIVVGVNAYQVEEQATDLEQLVVDPVIEERQRTRLAALRAGRDGERVSTALDRVREAACGPRDSASRTTSEPLMPLFIAAVEADCTLGEICGVLRRVWSEYRSRVSI
jgi:methylmalonyl-CoA mutase N-terminal domain/subunit